MEDLKRISTGQWCGSTWQKASPIWDHLTVPRGLSSHSPSARRQSRDSTREVSDVMTRIDHVSATTDEPTVSAAGSLPEPRPRPGRHPRPAPRRVCGKETPSKCVRSPRRARLTVPSAPSLFLPQADIRNSAEMELANVVSVPRRPAPPFPPRPRETPRPS